MCDLYHEKQFTYDPARKRVWKAIVEDVQKYVDEREAVLDIGCGYGDFINQISAERKIAVDLADLSNYLDPDVDFYQSGAQDISFVAAGSVGTVFCSNVLEHLDRKSIGVLLSEILRVLMHGGLLICIQPNFRLSYKRYFDDYTHVSIFTDASLCGLLRSHEMKIQRVNARYLPFSMQGKLPKSYWLTKAYLTLNPRILAGQMLVVAKKH